MLKLSHLEKNIEAEAITKLSELIDSIPSIHLLKVEQQSHISNMAVDFIADIDVSGKRHTLICEVKSSGQPRYVQLGLLQLSNYIVRNNQKATPILIAPYLSPQAQKLCKDNQINYLDFEGNAHLIFDNALIDRQVASKPVSDQRELRSIFKPKSAQILKVLLQNPERQWRVIELAEKADVSIGHVSNVRNNLLDREWAKVSDDGFFLSKPNDLLDAWHNEYTPPKGNRVQFYTTLHGSAFENAARNTLKDNLNGLAAFSSFSAANWIAPYGRTNIQYFYADEIGLERLKLGLNLSSSYKGENVVITVLKDTSLLLQTIEPAPGAICTDKIQTYLDLYKSGERGKEAAIHLREEKLKW